VFNNASDDKCNYLNPTLVITMNTFGGTFSITNNSDAGRISSFTGLSAGEIITVNSSLQTLSSSLGVKRLSNFNKKFFRLSPGVNNLVIQGNISSLAMTTQFVSRKIGG
jgi:phage-related protein